MCVLLAWLLVTVAAGDAPRCKKYSDYVGSEDTTLWLDGLAFQTSGLYPNPVQGGLILGVNLTGKEPTLLNLTLRNLPDNFGFRPHGVHLDNKSRRLYTVCHSDLNEEESIVVFDIDGGSRDAWPSLDFKYALVSPHLEYFNYSVFWFLNDVSAVDGENELFTTQFGPQPKVEGTAKDHYLWRCTWDDADLRNDGRLPASCAKAFEEASAGLNGISIDRATNRLFVNDLYTPQFWVFDRNKDGSLIKVNNIALPGVIDNVERDFASGDLQMGLIGSNWAGGTPPAELARGGIQLSNCTNRSANTFSPAYWPLVQDSEDAEYGTSTSLLTRGWAIIGSPYSSGPLICDMTDGDRDLNAVV